MGTTSQDLINQRDPRYMVGPSWAGPWPIDPTARSMPTVDDQGRPIGETWWVPFGEGFEIPAGFEFSGHHPGRHPIDWSIWIHVVDGVAQCLALRCFSPQGEPVTAEAIRLPLGRLVQEGVLRAARSRDEIPKRRIQVETAAEAQRRIADVSEHLRRSKPNPRQPGVITDDLLRRVAEIYRASLTSGAPTKAVADELHYSRASAGRLVMIARSRGFLPPTEQRKARG